MECSSKQIIEILTEYIHKRTDREVMILYLTDMPNSLEALAEETGVSISTVKRIINRNSFIYKYLPVDEPKMN
jgi:DNA-binding MarR family transcriptional regulator